MLPGLVVVALRIRRPGGCREGNENWFQVGRGGTFLDRRGIERCRRVQLQHLRAAAAAVQSLSGSGSGVEGEVVRVVDAIPHLCRDVRVVGYRGDDAGSGLIAVVDGDVVGREPGHALVHPEGVVQHACRGGAHGGDVHGVVVGVVRVVEVQHVVRGACRGVGVVQEVGCPHAARLCGRSGSGAVRSRLATLGPTALGGDQHRDLDHGGRVEKLREVAGDEKLEVSVVADLRVDDAGHQGIGVIGAVDGAVALVGLEGSRSGAVVNGRGVIGAGIGRDVDDGWSAGEMLEAI